MKKVLIAFAVIFTTSTVHAANLQIDLPYGIGSVQLPWQSTELLYGVVRSFRGGNTEEIAGGSIPLITLGKLASGYRIIDGSLGAVGAWPVQSDPVDFYGALGHDVVQDIPGLKEFTSAHLNGAITYSNAFKGWCYGITASYAFGGPVSAGS